MVQKKSVSSGRPTEAQAGFCRAIRLDDVSSYICVAGNAATNPDGSVYAPGDYYAQTKHILETLIKGYLEQVGASLENVVRTRVYVVDIQKNWEVVARAHGEVFGDIRPTATMIGTSALVHPDMVVEIDADAAM
ncbi:MAG: RidA family protein [Dehalococcoidia bacterium]